MLSKDSAGIHISYLLVKRVQDLIEHIEFCDIYFIDKFLNFKIRLPENDSFFDKRTRRLNY